MLLMALTWQQVTRKGAENKPCSAINRLTIREFTAQFGRAIAHHFRHVPSLVQWSGYYHVPARLTALLTPQRVALHLIGNEYSSLTRVTSILTGLLYAVCSASTLSVGLLIQLNY